LLWVKSNLSELRTGLEFKPATTSITTKRGTTIKTVKVEWSPAPVMMTAAEWYLLERTKLKTTEPKGAKGAAMTFLRELLGDGEETAAAEILAEAAAKDIKRGSLHAAKTALGIVVRKAAMEDGGWFWSWPGAPSNPSYDSISPAEHSKIH